MEPHRVRSPPMLPAELARNSASETAVAAAAALMAPLPVGAPEEAEEDKDDETIAALTACEDRLFSCEAPVATRLSAASDPLGRSGFPGEDRAVVLLDAVARATCSCCLRDLMAASAEISSGFDAARDALLGDIVDVEEEDAAAAAAAAAAALVTDEEVAAAAAAEVAFVAGEVALLLLPPPPLPERASSPDVLMDSSLESDNESPDA